MDELSSGDGQRQSHQFGGNSVSRDQWYDLDD
jgi:hypothetical protein